MAKVVVVLSGRPRRHYLELILDLSSRTRGLVRVTWGGAGKADFYLDPEGMEIESTFFDEVLRRALMGREDIVFAVGPPEGFGERPKNAISLGKLTMQHDLAALVLVEQLYRAYCRMKGIPYEK